MRGLNLIFVVTITVHYSSSSDVTTNKYPPEEFTVTPDKDKPVNSSIGNNSTNGLLTTYEIERYIDHNVTELVLDHFLVSSKILKAITLSTSDDTKKLRDFQKKEFESNEIYKDAWARGKDILVEKRKDPTLTAVSETKGIPDEYHIALITYSLAFPALYHDFNAKTRTMKNVSEVDSYQWKSYFKFLLLALNKVQGHPKQKPEVLYRGLSGWFKMNVGDEIMFQHFVSTSSESDIAKYFSFSEASTLFEIRGVVPKSIGLDHHSIFAEKEWVLAPRQLYSVQNVTDHSDRYKGNIRLVTLKSLGDSEFIVSCASYCNTHYFPLYASLLLVFFSVIGKH